jgi:hypothetical protein
MAFGLWHGACLNQGRGVHHEPKTSVDPPHPASSRYPLRRGTTAFPTRATVRSARFDCCQQPHHAIFGRTRRSTAGLPASRRNLRCPVARPGAAAAANNRQEHANPRRRRPAFLQRQQDHRGAQHHCCRRLLPGRRPGCRHTPSSSCGHATASVTTWPPRCRTTRCSPSATTAACARRTLRCPARSRCEWPCSTPSAATRQCGAATSSRQRSTRASQPAGGAPELTRRLPPRGLRQRLSASQ